jgi:hypothetical protein
MNEFIISNNSVPLNNINGSLVNTDNSSVAGIPFTSKTIPSGSHTLAPPGTNIQSAAGIYPCAQKGGKINRKKINKISSKYKMKGSKKTIKRNVRQIKSRVRSIYSKKTLRRNISNKESQSATRGARRTGRRGVGYGASRGLKFGLVGGAFQPPMTTPNYPPGYNQYQNNHY